MIGIHRWAVVAASVLALAWVAVQMGGDLPSSPQAAASGPAPAGEKQKAMPVRRTPADPSADPAIRTGLLWLVKEQQADGRWTMAGHAMMTNDVAATGMALLPFLSADAAREGSPAAKKFGPAVKKGIEFLIKSQKADDSFDKLMYAHAIATIALCEAYRQSGDAQQKKAAERGLALIIRGQAKNGAWGYTPDPAGRGDSSIAGWQCRALEAGERIGVAVPAEIWKRYADYLDSVAHESGSYGYMSNAPGSIAVTAECLLGRLRTGWKPDKTEFVRSVELIEKSDFPLITEDPYGAYFISDVMNRQGADSAWMLRYRAELLKTQQADGAWPQNKASVAYPSLMVTALNLTSLQHRAEYVPLPKPPGDLKEKELAALWEDLSAASVPRVVRAMRTLAALPRRSVPHLKTRIAPVKPTDAKRVAELLADLDSDTFAVRQAAEKELAGYGEGARGDLELVLKQPGHSLEFRRRAERLLEAQTRRRAEPGSNSRAAHPARPRVRGNAGSP